MVPHTPKRMGWRLTLPAARRTCWQSMLCSRLVPGSGIFAKLDFQKMECRWLGVSWLESQTLGEERLSGADAENPPCPLHPALLLLKKYLGWAGGACLLSSGIFASSSAFERLAVSPCLVGKRQGKYHSGTVMLGDPSGICKFCNAWRSSLPTSTWARHLPEEPAGVIEV